MQRSDLGLFNRQHMNAAIYQFKLFETASLHYADVDGEAHDPERIGLWDTTAMAAEPEAEYGLSETRSGDS